MRAVGQLGSLVTWYWHQNGTQRATLHSLHRCQAPSSSLLSKKAGKAHVADPEAWSSGAPTRSFSTSPDLKTDVPYAGTTWSGELEMLLAS